jgi:uncharacterized membrane protein
MKIQTTLFISGRDSRLDEIKRDLSELQKEFAHELHIVDINQATILREEYEDKAPVLDVGMFRLLEPFDQDDIRFAFKKAEERLKEAQAKSNDALIRCITNPLSMTKADKFSRWFSKHYMVILNGFAFIYVFFAFLAPVFMKVGLKTPAKTIYKIYSPLCHQLAFRSFFLFGEQLYYPRELAGMEGVITYGEATGFNEYDLVTARQFIGNDAMGYKLALCERDIAIYGAILLFGIVFSVTGKRIPPLPWVLWILIGLGPIGLDGFSQLLSQTGLDFFDWLPLRESTPFLRALTGGLFGLMTAWFGYPYLEESVQENRYDMQLKYAIVQQISESNRGQ